MAKNLALIFGIVFVVVGLVGFIPGGLGIVGADGVFATDIAHDLVHLISGIVFLLVALAAPAKSKAVLIIFGIVYLLVTVLGFIGSGDSILGLILINGADNYLHLILGLVILIAGLSAKNDDASISAPRMM